ncbi:tRNA-binding protein [Candidatus Woesearchaeota archaeon]|nr:tRNA-binding protein [Candidatus Woesearchaeota archaeon]
MQMSDTLTYEEFLKVDIRVGKIVMAEEFPEAKKPAYKLKIDFGDLGIKQSSAQLTKDHALEELEGMHVLCVVNFPPKQIGPWKSEVLTLGVPGKNGSWTLVGPTKDVEIGGRLA